MKAATSEEVALPTTLIPPVITSTNLSHAILFNNRFVVYFALRIIHKSVENILAALATAVTSEAARDRLIYVTRSTLPDIKTVLTCKAKVVAYPTELTEEEQVFADAVPEASEQVYLLVLKCIRDYLRLFPDILTSHGIDFTKLFVPSLEDASDAIKFETLKIIALVPLFKWSSRVSPSFLSPLTIFDTGRCPTGLLWRKHNDAARPGGAIASVGLRRYCEGALC